MTLQRECNLLGLGVRHGESGRRQLKLVGERTAGTGREVGTAAVKSLRPGARPPGQANCCTPCTSGTRRKSPSAGRSKPTWCLFCKAGVQVRIAGVRTFDDCTVPN